MWRSTRKDASVNNLAVHTHPAMGMVVTPYPKEWARCHIHAHRDGAPAGSGGSTGLERPMGRVLAAARLVVPACPGNAGPVGLPARSAQCIWLIRRRVPTAPMS